MIVSGRIVRLKRRACSLIRQRNNLRDDFYLLRVHGRVVVTATSGPRSEMFALVQFFNWPRKPGHQAWMRTSWLTTASRRTRMS